MPSSRFANAILWTAFLAAAGVAIAFFFFPAVVIRPFSHQNPHALAVAMALRQRAPGVTLIAGILSLIFAFVLWQGSWRRKTVLSILMVLVAFSAVMSRLNYFEWMFHPLDSPQFEAESASKLESGEMVLALGFANDARAYPIREMAYHHILNDVVAGVPVAVTY